MKKKIEQKWMKDQKKQINFQKKKRSLKNMKRSSEKQELPIPLFEVSLLYSLRKDCLTSQWQSMDQRFSPQSMDQSDFSPLHP